MQDAVNIEVVGSNPTFPAKFKGATGMVTYSAQRGDKLETRKFGSMTSGLVGPTLDSKPKRVRRFYLSKKRLMRVKTLLKETNFVKCVYCGPVRMWQREKILFYDVDFIDFEGNILNVREFTKGDYKDKLHEIIEILTRRVKIGTEITQGDNT